MKRFVMMLSITVVALYSCNRSASSSSSVKDSGTQIHKSVPANAVAVADSGSDGYTLLKQRCYICHIERPDAQTDHSKMQAPPMMGVKRHYLQKYPAKKDFVRAITEWVKHPDSTKALMPGAIREFGMMPAFPYPDEELQKIAEAIYDKVPNPGPGHKCGGGRGMHGKRKGRH